MDNTWNHSRKPNAGTRATLLLLKEQCQNNIKLIKMGSQSLKLEPMLDVDKPLQKQVQI